MSPPLSSIIAILTLQIFLSRPRQARWASLIGSLLAILRVERLEQNFNSQQVWISTMEMEFKNDQRRRVAQYLESMAYDDVVDA
ncbi:hypothetical protein N7468_000207 [Penicillium chermesinum]|uniref:Uncharacterized protein n=1 Tax=Penicillium chermesinum TaxID=63820 RepID=A0A9W9PJX0_9EURO|nr:uncharacterized protein N7468_000207 [Penicillium chermesinum]KAJ5248756.1 hypothetical protein N7468_000207 [Penicillium chermesinum]